MNVLKNCLLLVVCLLAGDPTVTVASSNSKQPHNDTEGLVDARGDVSVKPTIWGVDKIMKAVEDGSIVDAIEDGSLIYDEKNELATQIVSSLTDAIKNGPIFNDGDYIYTSKGVVDTRGPLQKREEVHYVVLLPCGE